MKKLALALLAAAAVLFGLAAPAGAQVYPPDGLQVSVSDPTPAPGSSFTVTATGCADGDTVTFTFNGETQTAVVSGGSASATFTAPSTAGVYIGTVSCGGVAGDFSVTVQSPTTPGGALPSTGSDGVGTTTTIAIGLLVVGLGLFAVATLRRRQTAAAA